jgi:hypothetical protein
MTYFAIAVIDGQYRVYETRDGIARTYIPTGAFGKPMDAVRYADMRQAQTSPLRAPDEDPVVPPLAGSSSGALGVYEAMDDYDAPYGAGEAVEASRG